jgi:hypothetical protein
VLFRIRAQPMQDGLRASTLRQSLFDAQAQLLD